MRLHDFFEAESNSAARAWIEKVYAKYPYTMQNNHVMVWGSGEEQQFAMFELVPSFSKRGAVEVKWIQAYPLRQGVGSRAMKELQALAREDGISLTLFPWDKGQVSQSKLTKFYRGQGFTPTVKGGKGMQWSPESNKSQPNVSEAFDQPYPIKWEKSDHGDYDALATLSDGTYLSIMFEHTTPYEVNVSFWRNNSLEVTGEGDAQRVFATVLTAIQEFLKIEQPANISFSASKEVEPGQNSQSRAKLYNRLVQRYAAAWGYDARSFDHGDQVTYELSRQSENQQGVTEAKKKKKKKSSRSMGGYFFPGYGYYGSGGSSEGTGDGGGGD